MAIIGTSVPTILDIAAAMAPDGSYARDRLNLLSQTNEMLSDMVWIEGNLPDGHKTNVITGLPSVTFRRINEGVPLSKSTGAAITEGAAMLEGFFQVDRQLAVMSGDVNKYRYDESRTFFESMNQTMQLYTLYGNAATVQESFTGIMTRYNAIGGQVLDAGGTSTDNTSILLISWSPDTAYGIYPKGTFAGFHHEDITQNRQALPGGVNGAMVGDRLFDANGNSFMGYADHFLWHCGLGVRDYRSVVRAANIDVSDLRAANVSAADIVSLMIKMTYMVPSQMRKNRGQAGVYRPAFYVNSTIKAALHLQAKASVSAGGGLNFTNIAGEEVLTLLGIPIREVDQMLTTEARVV